MDGFWGGPWYCLSGAYWFNIVNSRVWTMYSLWEPRGTVVLPWLPVRVSMVLGPEDGEEEAEEEHHQAQPHQTDDCRNTHAHAHTEAHTHTHNRTHTHTNTHASTHTHTYAHAHTHTRTHTHTYTHTQKHKLGVVSNKYSYIHYTLQQAYSDAGMKHLIWNEMNVRRKDDGQMGQRGEVKHQY